MKKLFLISALALSVFGCAPEERDTSNDCNCGEVIQALHLTLPTGEKVTTLQVRNNCSGQVTTIGLSGHRYAVGQQYCNN